MRTGMNLTIQDYFKRSGIGSTAMRRHGGERAAAHGGQGAFSHALDAARSSSRDISEPRGMRIRDYVARPVPSLRSLGTPVSPAKGAPPEISAPPREGKVIEATDNPAPVSSVQEAPATEKDRILASIESAAQKYKLPASLVRAVVKAESGYRVRAVSPAGAQGLMQLMPATANELGVENPFDIDQNIDGGAKYLRQMLDWFDGDIKVALSAYNAGPGTVRRYNGNVPYAETRTYVERVMRFSREFS